MGVRELFSLKGFAVGDQSDGGLHAVQTPDAVEHDLLDLIHRLGLDLHYDVIYTIQRVSRAYPRNTAQLVNDRSLLPQLRECASLLMNNKRLQLQHLLYR